MTQQHRRAALIGSLPLSSAEEVFRTVGETVGPACASVPDGETGARGNWLWISDRVTDYPFLEPGPAVPGAFAPPWKLRAGHAWADVDLLPIGYAAAAEKSYAVFRKVRDSGALAPTTRFQVSIPTPLMLSSIGVFGPWEETLAAFERAIFAELREMEERIPASDLTVQWDVAGEIVGEESRRQGQTSGAMFNGLASADMAGKMAAVARAVDAVPKGVEVGIHFCFGDPPPGKHIIEPLDSAIPVEAANLIHANSHRPVGYYHIPVPIERDDDAYVAPLRDLQIGDSQLILGLLHQEDLMEGAKRRMAAASRVWSDYGVATECGLRHVAPALLPALLKAHRETSELG